MAQRHRPQRSAELSACGSAAQVDHESAAPAVAHAAHWLTKAPRSGSSPKAPLKVQIGDAEITPRDTVPGGRLQLLFMAYSPRAVEPVLDYEAPRSRNRACSSWPLPSWYQLR